jgi:L-ascorbate metabolism protein UlaG (beta-lactamase superfamily)
MKITWFGHSAFRVDIDGAAIMIDPFLENGTYDGDIKAAYQGASHVVLTHGHDDHLGSTLEICQETGAMLISNWEICNYYAGKGIDNYSPGNHGGTIDFGAFALSFVDARHSSAAIVDQLPVYLGNPAGVILKAPSEKTLLHMGDTDIFSDMALINEIYAPDIGIVPIGDRFTMGARLAAMACNRFFNFETVIPCHYATFGLLDPNPDKFVEEMKGSSAKVLVPERGKAVEL